MKRLQIALLAAMGACAAAAESVPRAAEPEVAKVLQGQRKFLDASVAYCLLQVPGLKSDFSNARARAEAEIAMAEATIQEETVARIRIYQRYLDLYTDGWRKYVDQQMAALKRQNAADACSTLVSSWTNFEADVIVEDWHNFLQNNGPESAEAASPGATGARQAGQ